MISTFIELINSHGYLILFLSLMLELIALPIPTEILMSYAGYLAFNGEMSWTLSMVVGILGSVSGMTIAYIIGLKLGFPFFQKYGRFVHLSPERLNKMSNTFNRYRIPLLLFACFIPGVRHLTGYSAGINRLSFRSFAFFSYLGAAIWVSTFVTLGKVLGPHYTLIETSAGKVIIPLILISAAMVILYRVTKGTRVRIKKCLLHLIKGRCYYFRSILNQLFQSVLKQKSLSFILNSRTLSKWPIKAVLTLFLILFKLKR
ncbi:membrane protein DedA with SNARE-associated domain [Scopulibacillus darangshiensis]|uniref:Membrane protein DedA with SNARE-associated domain n=1 Tax=Scopulibacillus darangshiensis TaxID=442528 RepID=A0A4R2NSA5_9BACL|nr:DedA family protein [Scopulibacillus darangshiensis]TCP24839.1 membrane protein DedA with SNARE-associated domain [Scopulibacillus darangshiensis]